jgi:GNAT superfamily N-acetyltransferase
MKFLVSYGENNRLGEKLRAFPAYFHKVFLSSCKILVLCELNSKHAIAGCGITRVTNYLLIYVEEAYRGYGIGKRILELTVNEARKQGLGFVALAVSSNNVPALRLYRRCKFREIKAFKKYGFIIMMLPLTQKGELLYTFLRRFCLNFPEAVMLYAIEFLMGVTKQIRTFYQ